MYCIILPTPTSINDTIWPMRKNVKRLFNDFKPSNYKIEITPDKKTMSFSGSAIICGTKSGRPSQRITLHQKGLTITKATLTKKDKKGDASLPIDRINNQDNFDEVRLHSSQMIYQGDYLIELEFNGLITENMNGIYPCSFEQEGVSKQLIATQFESHHAREVFPCIDEPEAKATFDLSVTIDPKETVISNTPEKSRKNKGELQTVVFETTPIMSTYLLAFVCGDIGYKTAKTKSGIEVRAYATPDNIKFTDFSLDVAVKCLNYYEDYFGIDYPLKKCDMIALPDFASGAMENWGCITYREQCMLVDPNNTSLATKQYVAMVVAHELAHQWFGNLVTMRWWTDLWLNEGFASWIEYMAVDHIFPEWQMWTQFAVDEQHRALKLDALEHTHPIEVPINDPEEIRTIFDTISYSKGASVIHMLNTYLGNDTFRDGLKHYLSKNAYGNTDTVDLWQALEDISKKPVKDFMHSWTTLSGFPIISVTENDKQFKLHQSRFFINPDHDKKDNHIWPISIGISGADIPEIFDVKNIKVKNINYKFNPNQNGFYRVNYPETLLSNFGKQIISRSMNPLDRIGLISDVFEVSKAGYSSVVYALKFLEYFKDEDNNSVWDAITNGIISTRNVMDDEKLREKMKPYIITLTASQLSRLGWEESTDDSYFDLLLRPTILALACGADEDTSVRTAMRIYDKSKSIEDVNPNFRSLVFSTAARINNNQATFDKLFKMYKECKLSEEKTLIASALTSFKSEKLYTQALALIKSDYVRLQDISYWVVYSFSNRFAKEAIWNWIKDNWKWLEKSLGSDLSFYRFPLYAASSFTHKEFIKEYLEFFEPKSSPALERSIKQGLETLKWQSSWRDRDLKQVNDYFSQLN